MEDILIRKEGNIAVISINRPKVLNAFRSQTHRELTEAVKAVSYTHLRAHET